jgi:HPt (histidine-containing phosphotransfer) domain-containing protein
LFQVIAGLLPAGELATTGSGTTTGPAVPPELEAALEAVGGDRVLLEKIAAMFLDQVPVLMGQIRNGIHTGDGAAAAAAAHTMGGSLAVLAAQQAWEAAKRIEHLGPTGDRAALEAASAALEQELAKVVWTLEALLPPTPLARPA